MTDGRERIAELIPSRANDDDLWEGLVDAGLVTRGSQTFSDFEAVQEKPTGNIQATLDDVRADR